jgi:putative heme-binding domain-containing protein
LAEGVEPGIGKEMIAELRRGAEQWGRIPPPERWSGVVEKWAASEDADVRQAVRFLSITFGDASVFPALRQTAADPGESLAARRESLAALAQGRDPELIALLLNLLDDEAIRGDALPLLARSDSPEVADKILAGYASWRAEHRRGAIDVLISRPSFAHRLLGAIEDKAVSGGDLTALHVGRIGQLGDDRLVERLGQTWGAVRPTTDQIRGEIEELAGQLTPDAIRKADRSHGRELYAKSCGQCHILFGEGGKLGPDLTGADRGNVRYWLENILAPNAVVGKDYQTLTALTDDGRVITGLLREETDVAIVLEDAEKRVTLPRSEIESLAPTSLSLMPEGLLQQLTPDQIAAMVAYLQSPGQVPLPGQVPSIDPRTGKVPGGIEGEEIEVLEVAGGSVSAQGMGGFKADSWSGGSHLWWTDGAPGDSLTIGFPAPKAGRYEVMAVMTKAVDYGVVSARVNGSEPTGPIDLFNKPDVITTGAISLGKHDLAAGTNRLRLTLGEPNPAALPRNMVGLDYLFLVPVQPAP